MAMSALGAPSSARCRRQHVRRRHVGKAGRAVISSLALLFAYESFELACFIVAPATGPHRGSCVARGAVSDAGVRSASRMIQRGCSETSSETVPARWKRLASRLRTWGAVAAAAVAAYSMPAVAAARVARKYVSRADEKKAALYTAGALFLLFVGAYFNSRKEDTSENRRIQEEVQRLVRLKKEFEEAEAIEGADDDSMAASLRKAQEEMAKAKDGEGKQDGEDAGEAKDGEGDEKEGGDAETSGGEGGDEKDPKGPSGDKGKSD